MNKSTTSKKAFASLVAPKMTAQINAPGRKAHFIERAGIDPRIGAGLMDLSRKRWRSANTHPGKRDKGRARASGNKYARTR